MNYTHVACMENSKQRPGLIANGDYTRIMSSAAPTLVCLSVCLFRNDIFGKRLQPDWSISDSLHWVLFNYYFKFFSSRYFGQT